MAQIHAGDVVREMRMAAGYATAPEFAKVAGVSASAVYALEQGRTLEKGRAETKDKIARALGVTWGDILAEAARRLVVGDPMQGDDELEAYFTLMRRSMEWRAAGLEALRATFGPLKASTRTKSGTDDGP